MLYDAYGAAVQPQRCRAERQPLAEERIRNQLRNIDALLDIRWYPAIGRYAVVANWPSGDAKWQLYQSGEMTDHCEILGWYAEDMHDADSAPVNIEMFEQRVLALLASADNQRTPWKQRLAQVAAKNVAARRERRREILDRTETIAGDLKSMSGRLEEATMRRVMKEVAQESQRDS